MSAPAGPGTPPQGIPVWKAWARLIRVPNLLTVPGDPLAGFIIAAAGHLDRPMLLPMLAVAIASLCLYLFGLFVNDVVDVEVDRVERPDRPLPSGQLTVLQVRMAAVAAVLSGLNVALVAGPAALCVAGALAVLILAYNVALKGVPVAGVCAMGLCRGLSVLLGVAAARPEWFTAVPDVSCAPAALAAAAVAAYVIAVSVVAKGEMTAAPEEPPMGAARWVPFAVLLAALPAVLIASTALGQTEGTAPLVFVFLMVMALMQAWLLGGLLYRVQPVPDTVGGHIRNLLRVQACLCVAAGMAGVFPAFFLMALSFLFPRLAKHFYSS